MGARGRPADIKQLTRGITRGNQVYLPQVVLAERPRRVIRVTACQAPENMRMKDDSYVCWKDSSGTLVASPKVNWSRRTRSSNRSAATCNAVQARGMTNPNPSQKEELAGERTDQSQAPGMTRCDALLTA